MLAKLQHSKFIDLDNVNSLSCGDYFTIVDGSIVNVEGIVSWIAGNTKELCIDSTGSVQVLCNLGVAFLLIPCFGNAP